MLPRYIPPPKGGNTSNSTPYNFAPSPKVESNTAPAHAPASNAFDYARYVPPSAKPAPPQPQVPQKQYFDDEPAVAPKRKFDITEEAQSSAQPDSKKSKIVEPTPKDSDETPKKKKKKVRRGKRRTATTNDDDDDEDDDDKPAQKSPATKSESQKPVEQQEPQEENQVVEETVVAEKEQQKKDKKKEKKDKKKEKKDKKKKEKEQKQEQEESSTPTVPAEDHDEDVQMEDATEPTEEPKAPSEDPVAEEEKKEKRKEKKKKHKEPQPIEEEEEDKEENKRHRTVMERLEKSLKLAGEIVPGEDDEEDQGELHGLEPLPQPAPVVTLTNAKPSDDDTLPPWLAKPFRVSQDTRTPFSKLDVLPKACRVLEEKGFQDAFAVQTAAIPLLLPTSRPGDVCVSAATGSGKTLAYALPVTRDISQGCLTRLRALVVLPTRELVKQAQETFELCARAFDGGDRKRVRVGVSVGSQSFEDEQKAFMDQELRYDPQAYKNLQDEVQKQNQLKLGLSATDSLEDMEDADPRLSSKNGYVVDFVSKIDVLICTPGRLVEHMEQTPGFSLDYVRWLVVDEADKLLAQSFQGWLDVVMEKFRVNKPTARDFPDINYSGVRKIILSATLTRDLSLLNQLGLHRPQMIVLESDGDVQIAEHSLPTQLREYSIRVHDTGLKPLYLLDLLRSQDMLMASPDKVQGASKPDEAADSDTSSDSSSSPDSDSDSDSDATSDTSSDSDSESESEAKPKVSGRSLKSHIPSSLIFTKSNEAALRLSRLLVLLDPSLESHIGTLTSTTPTHIRRKTIRAFSTTSSPIRLLVASDLVARGIDLPNLDHVINYDMPPSVAGYVHRVGRTARAGKSGSAWTLVGDDESWFYNKIGKNAGIKRGQKMERTRIEEMDEKRVEEYEATLEKLGQEAGRR